MPHGAVDELSELRHRLRQVLRTRRALCLGFGAAVYLLMWIPILNLFFIPLAVVAGTLLFCGVRHSGDLPPPPVASLPTPAA